ncbi:MAG TPA: hypothetical protein VHL80_20615, partial [Polyangia bacterium]|nr:hypothetical protein [Polyangia bacterium]
QMTRGWSWFVLVAVASTVAPAGVRAQTAPAAPLPPPPPAAPTVAAAAPAAPAEAGVPLRLALELDEAGGVVTGSFHNQVLGARLDGRFSERLSFGASLGVGDLKGKDGRVHAALVRALLEYMAGDPAATVRYPLRFSTGYLAVNGPVAGVAGGLAVAAGKKADLIATLGSTVWITNNQNLLSLDLALEVAFRL